MKYFIQFLSSGCLAGYLPVAPGTWGTVVGFGFYWLLKGLPLPLYLATVVAFVFFAVWLSERARHLFGGDDPPKVVVDEIAGYLVTMAFHTPTLFIALAGFVLFRGFDILKPPPIRLAERRLRGGWGIVLDDVLAGVYANAALYLV